MSKQIMKPATMVYPVPAVMVSCGDSIDNYNIITIAWTGTINSAPPMTYVSVRKERHSHSLISKTGEFVINLTTEALVKATDFCGVKSGREVKKFEHLNLTPAPAEHVKAPLIAECPVNIECRVTQVLELGSHDMFIAEVLAVHVDEKIMDADGKIHLEWSKPICYSHGEYYNLGESVGKFGYSIMKPKTAKKYEKEKAVEKRHKEKTEIRKKKHEDKAQARIDWEENQKAWLESKKEKPASEKRAFGDKKPYGDKKPFGDKKPYGDKRSFGDKKPYGDKPYGEKKAYGDKPYKPRTTGEEKPEGERKSYSDKKPYEKKPYEKKPYEKKPYGDKKPYENKAFAKFSDKPNKPRKSDAEKTFKGKKNSER